MAMKCFIYCLVYATLKKLFRLLKKIIVKVKENDCQDNFVKTHFIYSYFLLGILNIKSPGAELYIVTSFQVSIHQHFLCSQYQ